MKTLIVATAIYLLLIVLVIALCKVRAISDKKAKEIFNNKTKMNNKLINKEQIIKIVLIIAVFASAVLCALIR